jgi:hypothetical protein
MADEQGPTREESRAMADRIMGTGRPKSWDEIMEDAEAAGGEPAFPENDAATTPYGGDQ